LVSVIICNYNYGHFLHEAIRSALNQSYSRVEIVVVDDGSTDDSGEVLDRQAPEVICLRRQHQGQTAALWAGVKASRGDIICFLDSDDVWFPGKIEAVVGAFNGDQDAAWIRHKLVVADLSLRPLGPCVPHFHGSTSIYPNPELYLERTVTVSTSALSVRRPVAQHAFARLENLLRQPGDAGPFGGMLYHTDVCLLTVIGAGRAKGFSLDRPLGYYRRHSGRQFHSRQAVLPMLEQQIEVGRVVSRIWSAEVGRRTTASHVYKHLLVVEALQGHSKWSAGRLKVFLVGLRVSTTLVLEDIRLALRQTLAIIYAYLAPQSWVNRLFTRQGYL